MAGPKGFYKQGGSTKPITEKKGIKESDLDISVKGNNDRIVVDNKKPQQRKSNTDKFMETDVFKDFMKRYKVDGEHDVIFLDGVPYKYEVNSSPPYVSIDNVKTGETVYFAQDEAVSELERDAGSLDPEIVFYYLESAGVFPRQEQRKRLVDSIKHGSKVTILTSNGQQITGKATMKSSMGGNSWVINTGGAHGRPAIASDDNVVKVSD